MAGSQAAWGIDVGVSSLKAIKLRRDGDRVQVEAFEVLEHDKFLTEPDVDRDALIRATLQKFMTKHSVRRDLVFIGVPGSSTFARFVKLPPVETKKIPEIVRFEAIQQIPFPLEQVNWDYHTFQHPDSPDVEVGIFAMKKELVAHVMSNFRAVNMMVHGVQMSPLAVYNAAAYDEMTEDKGTVIIDMGAEHTDIVIMDQGRVWLRSISTGGNHFTDALAKSFKQQFGKAEQLKKTAATSKYQKQIYQAMRPIFADLVAEIQRSLGAYNSSHRDSRLERIVCMGNPFKLPNLQKYLQQELKMEVCRLESFKKATVEKAAAFSENILSMSAAYGLAVQALDLAAIDTNLLPVEIARAMMWKKKQPWFIGATALLAVGALAMAGQWWTANSSYKNATANKALYDQNVVKANDFNQLVREWDQVSGNYGQAQKQVEDQFALLQARRVWPGITADIFSALEKISPNAEAQKPQGPLMVITSMTSEYSSALGAALPVQSNPDSGGAGGGAGGLPPGMGAPATPTPPATQPTDTDHGFLISISGYTRTGNYKIITDWHGLILAKAQPTDKKDYFYKAMPNQKYTLEGHQIQTRIAAPGLGGGMGGGAVPVAGAGATSAQAGEQPWVSAKPANGPYWEEFFEDVTGIIPAPKGQGPVPGAAAQEGPVEYVITQPLDLVATRAQKTAAGKPVPVYMAPNSTQMPNRFVFTLRFKVFIKTDIR
jgi:type IV pilus assembly protein PilM